MIKQKGYISMPIRTRITLLQPVSGPVCKPAGSQPWVRRITETRWTIAGIHVLFMQPGEEGTVRLETRYATFVISAEDGDRVRQLQAEMSDATLAQQMERTWDAQQTKGASSE